MSATFCVTSGWLVGVGAAAPGFGPGKRLSVHLAVDEVRHSRHRVRNQPVLRSIDKPFVN